MNIIEHIQDPQTLERLYRENKSVFKKQFDELYPSIKGQPLAEAWQSRLNYTPSAEIHWGSQRELMMVIIGGLICGLIAKFPHFFYITEESYYPRNIGFIVFPILSAYFLWKNKADVKRWAIAFIVMFISLIFINLLPQNIKSDTFILSCIHLPLLLWSVFGFSFGLKHNSRTAFLRYNGDLIVMSTIIMIAGGLMSGITIALFSLIGFNIAELYFENIGLFGAAAVPMVATYLVQKNPQLVDKVSPVVARIFSPLVLIMLSIYLVAVFASNKDPYNDREFLLLFNVLLIGVIVIIFFAVSEMSRSGASAFGKIVLFLLSIVTIVVNSVALSAILFRLQGGITPNRLAVLGGNILFLIVLVLIATKLYKASFKQGDLLDVDGVITKFLPVFAGWTIIVTFVFPLIFKFH